MLLLGIVGLPGSGKTTLSTLFGSLGAHLISGDHIGHEVLNHDPDAMERLVGLFGTEILEPDGTVSRQRLGERVSTDEESLRFLNEVVHPPLLSRLGTEIRAIETRDRYIIVVVDAALIPEWGIESYFDLVVYVQCQSSVRWTRLRSAGRDATLLKQLEHSQLAEADKRNRCHIVLDNEGTIDEFCHRGTALYKALAHGSHLKGDGEQCRRRLWTD